MKKWWQRVRGDVMGGASAAIVALPLALAFGIASGAGAMAGLYASVFGGLVAAVFGGCGVQITGPTGAMTVVLVSVISKYGVPGMLWAGVLAGLMQIIFGLLRFGKFIKYLPQPVIAGFTNGVSILFFMTAIGDATRSIPITIITVIVIVLALRFFKGVPESLFGLVVGLIVNELFIHSPYVVGAVSFGIPKPALSIIPINEIAALVKPAFTIFLLGSISALLSAEVTDKMTGNKHDSNRELIGQGLGNIVSSFFGGLPVSGAVARSGVNALSGGRTRLSGILHSIFLAIMVVVLAPVVKRIPLATLAAILMVASVRTADWKSIKRIPSARWTYTAIMVITTALTVIMDLTVGVAVGVLLSGILVLVDMAHSPRGKVMSESEGDNKASFTSVLQDVEIIAFHGPLYFVGVENVRRRIREMSQKSILVLNFSDVPSIDETGALALREFITQLKKEGKSVYIGGLNRKPLRMLIRMGVVDSLGRTYVCKSMECAVNRAIAEVSSEDGAEYLVRSMGNA